MRHARRPAYLPLLRPAGALLLGCAYLIACHLLRNGAQQAGHQPAGVYFLAVLLFLSASMGAALLTHGRHLFDPVPVSQRWMGLVPPRFSEDPWASEIDGQQHGLGTAAPRHDPLP